MGKLIEYLKNNLPLTIVLAVILVALVVLIVLLCTEVVRSKKKKAAAAAENSSGEPAPAERDEPAEQPSEEPSEKPSEEPAEQPAEEPAEQPKEEPEETAQPEETPAENTDAKTAETAKEEPMKEKRETKAEPRKAAAPKKPAPAKKESAPVVKKEIAPAPVVKKETGATGKWLLYEEDRGGFGFRLVASNGEEMLRSSSPYATLASAKNGIKTYQDNIAAGHLDVIETKNGNFFVQINNASKRLLATSHDYKTRTSCENALESIKRWAPTTVILVEGDEEK